MDNQENIGLDIKILQDGAISKYFKSTILDSDLKWFANNNYTLFDFDTSDWTIEKAHKEIKTKMDFPDYYGENLAAFNDCLGDQYTTDHNGIIIIFRHFDKFSKKEKDFCHGLLDVIAETSRQWLISGQRLIGIIQSDDPNIHYDKIGGNSPIWNRQEWFNADRIKS